VGNPGGSGPFTGLALACALLDDGEIKCWGGGRVNHYGALGDSGGALDRGSRPGEMGDKLPAVALGGHAARAVATGCSYACALIDNGQVRCWGNPHMGKMGAGDLFGPPEDPYAPVALSRPAVALTASAVTTDMDFAHSCALLDNGAVACWGNNGNGQLGLGDTVTRGDAQIMGRPVPLAPVDLGAGRKARAVVAGGTHTCALLDRGEVKCWGSNVGGLLGLGDTRNRGNAQGQMGDKLPPVALW
jgi:alpha-tubulin suppressor-like RCC1 family protein